jgi:DNA-binding XRE family transcriptional regulator
MSDLGEIAKHERLLIQRRRANKTQSEAAQYHGVSLSTYGIWERSECKKAPKVKISVLAAHECCLLYRKRANYTQRKVAKELGISRYWLNKMEMGHEPCDDLLWYWEQ